MMDGENSALSAVEREKLPPIYTSCTAAVRTTTRFCQCAQNSYCNKLQLFSNKSVNFPQNMSGYKSQIQLLENSEIKVKTGKKSD